jgi:hypothetical protein
MKKIIILVLMSISTLCVYSQSIRIDHVDNKGFRLIQTTDKDFSDFGTFRKMSISLMSISKDSYNKMSICIRLQDSNPFKIEEGKSLLLKTKDNFIELFANPSITSDTCSITIYPNIITKMYLSEASYDVTEEQLNSIGQGVSKLRLEMSLENYDRDFSTNKFSKVIKKDYEFIKEALRGKKSFYDGFK